MYQTEKISLIGVKLLNGLDLFSGIGGISLALSEWVRPVAYCETDTYCQGVLLSRMGDKSIPYAPIWDDVRTLSQYDLPRCIDIIYGGFPCQDISVAGNGKGLAGERSGLFFEILRLSKEIKPRFIFLENVPAITKRGGLDVVRSLAKVGYDCRWCVISAASVGACHKRERWFLLAHANDIGTSASERRGSVEEKHVQRVNINKEDSGKTQRTIMLSGDVADPESLRLEENRLSIREEQKDALLGSDIEHGIWHKGEKSPPPFLGVDDEIPLRVHRIKALGNAVVPCQAEEAFKILMGLK